MPDKRHRDTLRESDCSRKRKRVPPRIRNPCRDCPAEAKKQSNYPDEEGNRARLCAEHAHRAGSHEVQNPCRDCPVEAKKHSHHPDEEGNRNRLCAKHSKMVGSYQVRKHAHDREVGFNKDRISLSWFSVVLSRSLFGLLQPILLVLCTTDIRVDSVWIPCGFRVDSTPCGSVWIPCGSVSGRLRSVFVGNTQTILSLGMRRVYRL